MRLEAIWALFCLWSCLKETWGRGGQQQCASEPQCSIHPRRNSPHEDSHPTSSTTLTCLKSGPGNTPLTLLTSPQQSPSLDNAPGYTDWTISRKTVWSFENLTDEDSIQGRLDGEHDVADGREKKPTGAVRLPPHDTDWGTREELTVGIWKVSGVLAP